MTVHKSAETIQERKLFAEIWYAIFYGEFENEKKNGQKNFDLPERGFELQIFSSFSAPDLNFHGK